MPHLVLQSISCAAGASAQTKPYQARNGRCHIGSQAPTLAPDLTAPRHRALVCFKCNILLLQLFNNVLYKCPTTSQSDLSHPKSVSSQQPTRTAPGLAPAADWSHPVCRSSDSLTSQLGAECSRQGTEDAQPQDQRAGTVPCSRSVPCCSYGIAEP